MVLSRRPGCTCFFSASLSVQVERRPEQTLPDVAMQLATIEPIMAASSGWEGVRAVATLINDITRGVDTVIVGLQRSGALSSTTPIQTTSGNLKIKLNPSFNSNVTSTALGSRTYAISFEAWRSSDGAKFLELYFDNASSRNEVLAIWQPNIVDLTANPAGSNKMECVMTGGAANGLMVCSWNGPIENPGAVTAARFKVDSDSAAGTISVKGAAIAIANPCAGGNADVYSLAFISKSVSPYYTTARFGFNDNSTAATLCGVANSLNNGYFNANANPFASDSSKYFVQDGVTSDLDANYPTVASVTTLFGQIGGGADSDNVTINLAALTGLSVVFRGSLSPGF